MKKINIISFLLLSSAYVVLAQTKGPMEMKPEMTEIWDPEVPVVAPGKTQSDPPSDAIILFDGGDLSKEWTNAKGGKPEWKVENGCVTIVKGTGDIKTKRVFEDCQLHIEWRSPEQVEGEGQGRGNIFYPTDDHRDT